jgi:hypothetical protein
MTTKYFEGIDMSNTFDELFLEYEDARNKIRAAIKAEISSNSRRSLFGLDVASRVFSKSISYKRNEIYSDELHPAVRDALFISSEYTGSIEKFATDSDIRRENLSELFWPDYYLSKYQDLPAGLDCWAHFIEFGMLEGRSPHPFLDLDVLSMQISLVEDVPTLLQYFLDSSYWDVIPCRWVDIHKFEVNRTQNEHKLNSLSQIMRSSNLKSYMESNLIEIDSSGSMVKDFGNLAYIYFAADWSRGNFGNQLRIVDVSDALTSKELEVNEAIVFPGFGFVHNSLAKCFANKSSDHTKSILRAGFKVAYIDSQYMQQMDLRICIVFRGITFRDEILQLVNEYDSPSTVYFPSSRYQAKAISEILGKVNGVGEVHFSPKRMRDSTLVIVNGSNVRSEDSQPIARKLGSGNACVLISSDELDVRAINFVDNFPSELSLIVFDGFKDQIAELVSRQTGLIFATSSAIELYSGYMSSGMITPLETMMSS